MSTPEQKRAYRSTDRERVNAAAQRYRDANRERVNEQGRRHAARFRADNLELVRARERVRALRRGGYGITVDDYADMLAEQGGVCAVCRQPETSTYKGTVRSLAVDHDHKTGRLRELLCLRCNLLIGQIEAGDEGLVDAIFTYIRRHQGD